MTIQVIQLHQIVAKKLLISMSSACISFEQVTTTGGIDLTLKRSSWRFIDIYCFHLPIDHIASQRQNTVFPGREVIAARVVNRYAGEILSSLKTLPLEMYKCNTANGRLQKQTAATFFMQVYFNRVRRNMLLVYSG